jgi:hypothetical protein
MRSALVLAVTLLALVVLLEVMGSWLGTGAEARTPTSEAVHVVAASRGTLHTPGTYGGEEALGNVIQIEETNLSFPGAPPGLRLAELDAALELREHVLFDTAGSDADAAAFARRVGEAPIGAVFLLATMGEIAPSTEAPDARARAALLGDAAAALGAETRPFEASPASWALLAVRLDAGWVKLAEVFSTEIGVVLAFTLDPDLERYEGFDGETLVRRAAGNEILLYRTLDAAESRPRAVFKYRMKVGGLPGAAIYAPLPEVDRRAESSVRWEALELGAAPVFRCKIGLRDDAWDRSDGAVFEVLVDGEVVGSRSIGVDGPPDPPAWEPWEIDLAAFAGRRVSFELRVDSHGHGLGDLALWGEPVLFSPEPGGDVEPDAPR